MGNKGSKGKGGRPNNSQRRTGPNTFNGPAYTLGSSTAPVNRLNANAKGSTTTNANSSSSRTTSSPEKKAPIKRNTNTEQSRNARNERLAALERRGDKAWKAKLSRDRKNREKRAEEERRQRERAVEEENKRSGVLQWDTNAGNANRDGSVITSSTSFLTRQQMQRQGNDNSTFNVNSNFIGTNNNYRSNSSNTTSNSSNTTTGASSGASSSAFGDKSLLYTSNVLQSSINNIWSNLAESASESGVTEHLLCVSTGIAADRPDEMLEGLKILKKLVVNIVNNPNESKYRRVNLSNCTVQKKVLNLGLEEVLRVFKVIGFVPEGTVGGGGGEEKVFLKLKEEKTMEALNIVVDEISVLLNQF